MADIKSSLRQGKEYGLEWGAERARRVTSALIEMDFYLTCFDPVLTYDDCSKKTKNKSCWFASKGLRQPLLQTEAEISKLDAELAGGKTGLEALEDRQIRTSMANLQCILDSALLTASRAIGIDSEIIQQCTIRYQVKYTDQTISLRPASHLLTAMISTGPGMLMYDIDGAIRKPEANGTIIIGGTTLYRWTEGRYLPTFHEETGQAQGKISIAAFLDFPDMTAIPRSSKGREFLHDKRRMKEDDQSRTGELRPLWDILAERHKFVNARGSM